MLTQIRATESSFGINYDLIKTIIKKEQNLLDYFVEIDYLPFIEQEICFSDDSWDFSFKSDLNINKNIMKFYFHNVNAYFRVDLKKYVLIKIIENKYKISSIKNQFLGLVIFFNYLANHNIFDLEDIDNNIIELYLNSRKDISFLEFKHSKNILKIFFETYSIYNKNKQEKFESLNKSLNQKYLRAIKNEHKTQNIPKDYFQKLINVLIKIIDSEDEDINYRTTACVLLILSQTGLRISEILSLELNSLDSMTLDNNEVNFLKYKTWKRSSGNNQFEEAITFVNPLTKKAISKLIILQANKRQKYNSKLLYLGNKRQKRFPINSNSFRDNQLFFYEYLNKKFLMEPTEEISNQLSCVRSRTDRKIKIIYPKTPQFRVYVCSDLYEKGVPIQYIKKFMGHLSYEMEGYYIRSSKNEIQENYEFSKKTLEEIIANQDILIGQNSNILLKKINTYINNKNLTIKNNYQEIIDSLLGEFPIRQKTGGVCIKNSTLRECSFDLQTNDFFCAYGVCPNIFYFFYNIDISYRKLKNLEQTIKYNQINNFNKQVQKELNMFKSILENQFIPEYKELENQIQIHGKDNIISKYPNLLQILKSIECISEELRQWIDMI